MVLTNHKKLAFTKKGVEVERLRVLSMFITLLWSSQSLNAGIVEPKPVFPSLYTSLYEQQVLLEAIQGGQPDALSLLLANAPEMDTAKEKAVRQQLTHFIQKFKKKQTKYSEKTLLQQLYFAVHRTFLKSYQPYQSFYSLLSKGKYNCLSGTALYAYLLNELGFQYQVYETDYHIFLLVHMGNGAEIMFESTDPLYGFIEGEREISQRLDQIKQDALPNAAESNKAYYDFELNVIRPVSLTHLAGLQYFNQAAAFYNAKRIKEAENALSKGNLLYQAERFERFAQLLTELQ